MDFDFSDDEKLIADQTARYLDRHCGSAQVRAILEGDQSFDTSLWQGLAAMGLMGTAVPERFGGVDAGPLALCLVARELGSHLAPIPFSSSVYLASQALLQFGTDAQQQQWLPGLATGELVGTVAVVEAGTELRPQDMQLRADPAANGEYRLSGSKLIVADGSTAHLMVVLARAPEGLSLFLVDTREAGTTRTTLETIDPTRDNAKLAFDEAPAVPLGALGDGWTHLLQLYDRAAVLLSFEQLGGAERALDMAVGYAKERFAFGRPIGSFQGLKHLIADMYVALKLAESNCYYAAWALAADAPDLSLAAATARVSATKAFQLCASDNIQVHGGMGFTWEFDCHLYYRRSNYLALMLGGQNFWESRLVEAVRAEHAAREYAA